MNWKQCYWKVLVILLVSPLGSTAQSAQYTAHSQGGDHILFLDLTKGSEANFHSGLRNYFRSDVLFFIKDTIHQIDSEAEKYLIKDNQLYFKNQALNEERKGFIKDLFYKQEANFFRLEQKYFKLYINPIIEISFGKEKQRDRLRFMNLRGAELYGLIDNKVYFYSNILENQGNFHNYIEDRIRKHKALPGYSFFKPFNSRISNKFIGHDFANARGYLGVPISKHISLELGHGTHFIGHGYHSLLLEDYSNNYFYLKLNTRIWKLHYQNLYAELAPISTRLNSGDDQLLPKKYMTSHYLSYKPFKNLELGIYESIIFARPDNFEFHYLNPLILYRTVEYYLNSPDNVIIGLNGKWNIKKKVSLYGQFILDDIKFDELGTDSGWWGNKYGIQAGIFYPNVGKVENLNLRLESNIVRPYTYTHRDTLPGFPNNSIANYSNYNQPLAHPLGANFWEVLAKVDYQYSDKLFFSALFSFAKQGRSGTIKHAGDEILLPDELRPSDFGIDFLQGDLTTISALKLHLSYSFFHNYHLDINYLKRTEKGLNGYDTDYFGLGIRANIQQQRLDY